MKNTARTPYPVRRIVRRLWPWLEGPFATGDAVERSPAAFSFEVATYACPILNPIAQRHLFEGKLHNLALAVSRMDGLVVRQGELFSFWRMVGPPDEARGFREGATFIAREVRSATGGGLCQLSGLLYNLALLSGAAVLERHPHSIDPYGTARYVPLGRDATVTFPRKDLCFQNAVEQPLLLKLELSPTRLRGSLFAPSPLPWKILLFVTRPEREPGHVVTLEDPALPAGTTHIEAGFEGKRVQTWRWFVTDQGIVKRELLSKDLYRPTPTVIRLGVRPRGVSPRKAA